MPTAHGNIGNHFDSAGRDVCPTSGEPYILAGNGRRNRMLDREWIEPEPEPDDHAASEFIGHLRMERLERLINS